MNEEDEKGLWDARSGLRTTLGLGFEVGANTLLDIFSFVPPAQVAGGTFINYLAQKIRGGEISKGELTAAGLTSLIPGGAQAGALTRGGQFTRSIAKGGLSGGITTTSMSLIDEGELPSFGEFAGGVGLGGAFGGAFDLAPAAVTGKLGTEVSEIADDTIRFTTALKSKINTGYDDTLNTLTRAMISPDSLVKEGGSVIIPPPDDPIGKITKRNMPKIEKFLLGKSTSIDRTTAGLIQDPNFKLSDFLSGIEKELPKIKAKYPRIDIDTNFQRFKWQWHHINPDKMPVDFYVNLDLNDRQIITDTLLKELGISAGMNPTNRIGLPTEVHDEITDWLNVEIGKRSTIIKQKIANDLGFNLTLTGSGSRAANLKFNQLFANVPVQQRLSYIREYGKKITESTKILDDLMEQFDIFYQIPEGYRLDLDVNIMEQMLKRLDEGKPTIRTLREIILEVTDGMRIPVSDDFGRQAVAVPRNEKLIRAIDLEGMLRDHKNEQSVLNQRQINAIRKELNEIYQMNLDIQGASMSAYIRSWYNRRFGGTRRTGKK